MNPYRDGQKIKVSDKKGKESTFVLFYCDYGLDTLTDIKNVIRETRPIFPRTVHLVKGWGHPPYVIVGNYINDWLLGKMENSVENFWEKTEEERQAIEDQFFSYEAGTLQEINFSEIRKHLFQ